LGLSESARWPSESVLRLTVETLVRGLLQMAGVVREFRDLVAWQLSYQLKCEVFAFTAIGLTSRDFKYRDQIRDATLQRQC
jgi:hypothetical protein